jgi:hypothetical protein
MRGGPPEPGDLFVLAATEDLPVEWAILDGRPGSGELLAVPADTNPLTGSGDVEVPATEPGGPLSLRCRFATWLDAGLFRPDLRSGSLAAETVAEARQRVRRVDLGALEPSPLAEEVDAESEYRDWIRDVPERARALALAARPGLARKPRSGMWGGHVLAAAFALLSVGLGVWVAQLRREVDRLSVPVFDVPYKQVVLGETTRGGRVLEVPPGATHIMLLLEMDDLIPDEKGRFEILDAQGHAVWRNDSVRLTPGSEIPLFLTRAHLPDGEYRIRIVPEGGGRPIESTLGITTKKPAI